MSCRVMDTHPSDLLLASQMMEVLITSCQDLQLPPAFCLPHDAPISLALEAAYEREFDQLPLVDRPRAYSFSLPPRC